MDSDQQIDAAIGFAARDWLRFLAEAKVPANFNLRDQIAYFAPSFRKRLLVEFPALQVATDQVLLLIVARGVEESGTASRERIERTLGIILPR